ESRTHSHRSIPRLPTTLVAFLFEAHEGIEPGTHAEAYHRDRCITWDPGYTVINWRGRSRSHGAHPSLSKSSNSADRWFGHCTCSSAYACFRYGPLASRRHRHGHVGFVIGRIAARNNHRELPSASRA